MQFYFNGCLSYTSISNCGGLYCTGGGETGADPGYVKRGGRDPKGGSLAAA